MADSPALEQPSPAFRNDQPSPAFTNPASPAFMLPQSYPPVYAGLEALANAALPNLAPQPMAQVPQMDPTSAIGDLNTPLHTTPADGIDLQAALDTLNFSAYNWQPPPDDDTVHWALSFLDDLGEDANDADFVPPTSPKGDSDSESDDDEDEDEEERKKARGKKAGPAPTPTPPDEEEDLFLPIEDVPVPEDQLYADAMKALGVSTPDELKVVVNKIVETASKGGVTPEQVEGLRRLMRLAEVRGAALTSAAGSSGRRDAGSSTAASSRVSGSRETSSRTERGQGGERGREKEREKGKRRRE
jgi:hypothetical protein